jgi:uncharacterized protein YprB with RNaseH-like and TPR domain
MLEHTFIHLPGVGEVTERSLWEQGILTWHVALDRPRPPARFSGGRWELCRRMLGECIRCLETGDHRHFAACLPGSQHWRTYREFRRRTAFLDIETTGLGALDQVTVVGLYDGVRTTTFVAGDNLDELPEALAQYCLLVTYNGATFDLPFLLRRFPGLDLDHLHVDLRYPLRRLGLRGGLKHIEQRVGLRRDPEVAGLDGWDAVRLWREYQAGSETALATLIKYNTADIENLEHLMELAYRGMRRAAGLPLDDANCGEGARHA